MSKRKRKPRYKQSSWGGLAEGLAGEVIWQVSFWVWFGFVSVVGGLIYVFLKHVVFA